jgi:hypothetical protein
MAWTLKAHAVFNGGGSSSNGFTSSALNTSGCDLIVVTYASGASSAGVLTDSLSNTWHPATQYQDGFSDRYLTLIYAWNATGGSAQTFTITGTGIFPALVVEAWSGSLTSSTPFDQLTGTGGYAASGQPGSITPSVANALVVCGLNTDEATSISINGTFTISDSQLTGVVFGTTGAGEAYVVQTTAVAENPTWTFGSGSNQRWVSSIASFKPSGGAAAAPLFLPTPMTGLGVGGPFFPHPIGKSAQARLGV